MHYNPCTAVEEEPEDGIGQRTFPFVDGCHAEVVAAMDRDGVNRYTAFHFLLLLKKLRPRVILQDFAATSIRITHYSILPVRGVCMLPCQDETGA
jgi:hypothetical protein